MAWVVEAVVAVPNGRREGDGGRETGESEGRGGRQRAVAGWTYRVACAGGSGSYWWLGVDAPVRSRGRRKGREGGRVRQQILQVRWPMERKGDPKQTLALVL